MNPFYKNLTPRQRFGFAIILISFFVIYSIIGLISHLSSKPTTHNDYKATTEPSITIQEPNFNALKQMLPAQHLSNFSDSDDLYRTIEYYKAHESEMKIKISECRNHPQSDVGYQNCLNAEKTLK
ncbi:MAG: hypothetical protein EKK54_06195 [Neisseriaceae bacterium]|nr:MAG: hypothetical protein EKK54_06195 [Neisseriaceae bacterium]